MKSVNELTNDKTFADMPCPPSETWLELLAPTREGASVGRDAIAADPASALANHLDVCAACQGTVADVRRYHTLLLKGRAPTLSNDQRASMEDRVRMLSAQWAPPPRVSPKVAMGVALALAATLVLFIAKPFMERRAQAHREWNEMVSESVAPSLDKPGPGVATSEVEGDVQVADRDGRWHRLIKGDALRPGMRLRHDRAQAHVLDSTRARVVVPNRFELSLGNTTEVEVLSLRANEAFMRLREGDIDCQVSKLRPGQRFAVMFSGFRASVLGTRFAVRHDSASSGVQVQVVEGAVRVDSADDPYAGPSETTTTVRAGQRWHYAAGRMALEPIPAINDAAVDPAVPSAQGPANDPLAPAAANLAMPVKAAADGAAAPAPAPAVPVASAPVASALHGDKGSVDKAELEKAASDRAKAERAAAAKRAFVIEVPHQTMQAPADDARQADDKAPGADR